MTKELKKIGWFPKKNDEKERDEIKTIKTTIFPKAMLNWKILDDTIA